LDNLKTKRQKVEGPPSPSDLDNGNLGNLNSSKIAFVNPEGKAVLFQKAPRIHEGHDLRMKRLKTVYAEMVRQGIKPTHRALARLGFGSRIITDVTKEEKKKNLIVEENKQ
jgi:hypothetical protein